jgi:phage-related minor tail protein
MDLTSLKFVVETKELDDAIKKIEALGVAVQGFNNINSAKANSDREAAKATKELAKEQEKAAKAAANLAEAEAKAAKSTTESGDASVETGDKVEKLVTRYELLGKYLGQGFTRSFSGALSQMEMLGGGTEEQSKRIREAFDIIGSLNKNPFDSAIGAIKSIGLEFESLTNRANLLNAGISLSTKQLYEYSRISSEIKAQMKSAGIDPSSAEGVKLFDRSLKELQATYLETAAKANALELAEKKRNADLKESEKAMLVAQQANANMMNQAVALFRKVEDQKAASAEAAAIKITQANNDVIASTQRLNQISAMVQGGMSPKEATIRFDLGAAKVQQRAIEDLIAAQNNYSNSTSTTSGTVTKANRDMANSTKWLTTEEEKMASVLRSINEEQDNGSRISEKSARSIANYERHLRQAGITGDAAAAKLSKYKDQQMQIMKVEEKRQIQYLQRGLQPQIGDVVVSLASGQNPLTVMLQQGDQIRGLIAQTGVQGEALQKAMAGALSGTVESIKMTAGAMTSLLGGAFVSVGNTAKTFVTDALFLMGQSFIINGRNSDEFAAALERVRLASITLGKIGIIAVIAALATLSIAAYQSIKEQNELSKSLILTGGSLGLTKNAAVAYAASMNTIGISTSQGISVITEMAKVGGFAQESIALVTRSAIDMERYAGVAISETVKQFAKMKEKPVEALSELAIATGLVNPEIMTQIRLLDQQGKSTEASALAMKTLGEVTAQQSAIMRESLTPLEQLWIDMKEEVSSLWSAVKSFANSTVIVKSFELALLALREMKNLMVWMDRRSLPRAERDRLAVQDRLLELANKNNTVVAASAEDQANLSELEKARSKWAALTVKSLTDEEKLKRGIAELESTGRAAKMEEKDIAKAVADFTAKTLKNVKEASSTFVLPKDTTMQNIKKEYSDKINAAKSVNEEERKLNKLKFDYGLIDREAYISQDLALLKQSEDAQLQAINSYQDQYNKAYSDRVMQAVQARDKALSDTSGKKGEAEARTKITEQYNTEIQNLAETAGVTTDAFILLRDTLSKTVSTREIESILGFEKAVNDNRLASEKWNKTRQDGIENRRIEAELQERLLNATGAEAAKIQGVIAEQKIWTEEINRTNIELAKSILLFENSLNNPNATNAEIEAAYAASIAQREVADQTLVKSRVATEKAGIDAVAKYQRDEYKRITDELTDSVVTALFDGGKSGSKKIRDAIIAELKKPITAIVNVIVQNLTGDFLKNLSAGGLGGGIKSAMGTLSSVGGAIKGAGAAYNAISGGLNVAAAGGAYINNQLATSLGGYVSTAMETAISDFGAGMMQTGNISGMLEAFNAGGSQMAGMIAGSVLNGFAGYSLSKMISGGYKTGLGGMVDIAGGIASMFFGPIAGVISGAINRLFGRKLTKVGIKGTFGGEEGFQGVNFKYYKGGVFRSNKTKTSPLDPAIQTALGDQFKLIRDSVSAMGGALGIGAEALDKFTYNIKLNFMKKNQAQIDKMLEAEFNKMAEAMAKLVLGTTEYNLKGETAVQTLTRLTNILISTNQVFEQLGFAVYKSSLAGAAAAVKFNDLLGGAEKAGAALGQYYQKFYSEQEILTNATEAMTKALADLGVAMPVDKAAYRARITAAMAAGDQDLAAKLILLSSAFAEISDASTSATEALKAAWQGVTDSIFEEVKRIRGLTTGTGNETLASAQAKFAIASAQATAGDKTAAESLPELSRNLLEIAGVQAATLVELRRIQLLTANSLQATGTTIAQDRGIVIPPFAAGGLYQGGLALVGEKGPELINFNSPGQITNANSTASILNGGTGLQNLVIRLNDNIEGLRHEMRADVSHNANTSKLLTRLVQDGETLSVSFLTAQQVTVV